MEIMVYFSQRVLTLRTTRYRKGGNYMIRQKNEIAAERKPAPFNGKGEILVRSLLNGPEELYNKGRVFAHTTVHPDSAIGYHVHHNESETYSILSGRGIFNDNGVKREIGPGEVLFTGDGEGHGLEAAFNEPIEMIALILYK